MNYLLKPTKLTKKATKEAILNSLKIGKLPKKGEEEREEIELSFRKIGFKCWFKDIGVVINCETGVTYHENFLLLVDEQSFINLNVVKETEV